MLESKLVEQIVMCKDKAILKITETKIWKIHETECSEKIIKTF